MNHLLIPISSLRLQYSIVLFRNTLFKMRLLFSDQIQRFGIDCEIDIQRTIQVISFRSTILTFLYLLLILYCHSHHNYYDYQFCYYTLTLNISLPLPWMSSILLEWAFCGFVPWTTSFLRKIISYTIRPFHHPEKDVQSRKAFIFFTSAWNWMNI